jgi:plastocyanin
MHPIGVASAAWVLAAAPSKTPFYIVGGALAACAVLLAAVGMSHAEFPRSQGAARGVMAAAVVLVAATMVTAVVTAGEESKSHAATAGAASGQLQLAADPTGNPAYDRKTATVASGKVQIRFVNRSPVAHNVTIAKGNKVLAHTKTITSSTTTVVAELPAGDYVFYCSVDEHRQAGMQGTLTVR